MSEVVTPKLLAGWPLPEPDPDADKVERGQVLVVAGSVTVPGAALLAGIAALRAGAGKLQVVTTASTAVALGVAIPEALVAGVAETAAGGIAPDEATVDQLVRRAERAAAVLVGPGLTDDDAVRSLVELLLPRLADLDTTVVLDAAAVRAITPDRLPGQVVMTPNRRELSELVGDLPVEQAAKELNAVIAVMGEIAAPDGRVWRHEGGDAGLATSGSGDVLAGIVTGLCGRGADPAQAAVWGMAAHARAGARLATRIGRIGYLARELLDEVSGALDELSGG